MTLELNLRDVRVSKGQRPKFIYADGGQAGSIRLNCNKQSQYLKCSGKDYIKFIICGDDSQLMPKNKISTRDFWAESTVSQNKSTWYGSEKNPVQFTLQYFDENDEKLGELVFDVKYTRGLFYCGEMQGQKVNLLPFYKGRCPTYNLYNCLDGHPQTTRFNLIEQLYRDK